MTKTVNINMSRAELAHILSEHLDISLDENDLLQFNEDGKEFNIKAVIHVGARNDD